MTHVNEMFHVYNTRSRDAQRPDVEDTQETGDNIYAG